MTFSTVSPRKVREFEQWTQYGKYGTKLSARRNGLNGHVVNRAPVWASGGRGRNAGGGKSTASGSAEAHALQVLGDDHVQAGVEHKLYVIGVRGTCVVTVDLPLAVPVQLLELPLDVVHALRVVRLTWWAQVNGLLHCKRIIS